MEHRLKRKKQTAVKGQTVISEFFASPTSAKDAGSGSGCDGGSPQAFPVTSDPFVIDDDSGDDVNEVASRKRCKVDAGAVLSPQNDRRTSAPAAKENRSPAGLASSPTLSKRTARGTCAKSPCRQSVDRLKSFDYKGDLVRLAPDSEDLSSDSKRQIVSRLHTQAPARGSQVKELASFINVKQSAICVAKSPAPVSYTPLERQVVALKEKHPDVLLFVECGYKYRFFGEDAEIASRELNIFSHVDHNFLTASIPVHRLNVHVSRLVHKGYKVGVVRQTETAALKAAGENKNAPFTRQLVAVYTEATLVGEQFLTEEDEVNESNFGGSYILLLSLCPSSTMVVDDPSGSGSRRQNASNGHLCMLAIDPGSGDVIFDFTSVDSRVYSTLETYLEFIKPSEIILARSAFDNRFTNFIDEYKLRSRRPIRIERVDFSKASDDLHGTIDDLCKLHGKEFNIMGDCIASMRAYLKDFGLEKILSSLEIYRRFSEAQYSMHLPGNTVRNLELLENNLNGQVRGSLLWIVDHTVTAFGGRLLRRWLLKPLLCVKSIEDRLAAVTALKDNMDAPFVSNMRKNMHWLSDLDKGLSNIVHRRSSPSDFLKTLSQLEKFRKLFIAHSIEAKRNVDSELLLTIYEDDSSLSMPSLDAVMCKLNADAVKASSDKSKLFRDLESFVELAACVDKAQLILNQLEGEKKNVRRVLGNSSLDYVSVSGSEFLVEVKNSTLKVVPADWVKVSSTKQVCRFRSPAVDALYKQLCQVREQTAIEADKAWEKFLTDFLPMSGYCRAVVRRIAEFDCLYSLAVLARQSGYCRPTLRADGAMAYIKDGRHPVIDALLGEHEQFVPNDTSLDDEMRCMVITGPNMGGKSSYIKQVALICLLAQIGSYVPACEARVGIIDAIYTRMGANDDIARGKSTFMVEMEEASTIICSATPRSLVILDEIGRGTSTHDGFAIAYATLLHFVKEIKAMTLFVTHYLKLSEFAAKFPQHVRNVHMAFMQADNVDRETGSNLVSTVLSGASLSPQLSILEPANCDGFKLARTYPTDGPDLCTAAPSNVVDVGDRISESPLPALRPPPNVLAVNAITFLYKLTEGSATKSYGLNVARLAGIPWEILSVAATKTAELEESVEKRGFKLSIFAELFGDASWRSPSCFRQTLQDCRNGIMS